MQAIKSKQLKAKAATEKIITEESLSKESSLTKIKKYVKSIFLGDINDLNLDSPKIKNHNAYLKAKNAQLANSVRLQTFIR